MIKSHNNLAELLAIEIDRSKLTHDWHEFIQSYPKKVEAYRLTVTFDMLPKYSQTLISNISETIDEIPKNLIFQIFDRQIFDDKKMLGMIHKDVDRLSNITIPIEYNQMEPIMFYDEKPDVDTENSYWPVGQKPTQIGRYSQKHPTLVNVNNLHNVRLIDDHSPRVLLQMSLQSSFDDIIEKNSSFWRII